MEGRSTRSRVTLPDEILQVSQESPLKKARSRNRDTTSTSSSTESSEHIATTGEHELLLSPEKTEEGNSTKRSASPPAVDEYAEPGSLEIGRGPKRLKTSFNLEKLGNLKSTRNPRSAAHSPSHTRNLSDSNVLPADRVSRRAARRSSKKPNSAGHKPFPSHSSPPPDPSTGRAQSVPIFSSSFSLPHIDLRHPPPSPTRNRSRSPSKDSTPKLHINPLPKLPSLEPILDESTTPMNVDTGAPSVPAVEETNFVDVVPLETCLPAEPFPPEVRISDDLQVGGPETPVVTMDSNIFEHSSLSLVPEMPQLATPLQGKLPAQILELAFEDPTFGPKEALPVPKPSLLPRPSLGNPVQSAQALQIPPPSLVLKRSSASRPAVSQKRDAFAVLMKRKPPAQAKPVIPNQRKRAVRPGTFEATSTSKPGNRIKSAMKPKPKGATPAPAPALVPLPSDEEEVEDPIRKDTSFYEYVDAAIHDEEEVAQETPRDEEELNITTELIAEFTPAAAINADGELEQYLDANVLSTSENTSVDVNDPFKANVEMEEVSVQKPPSKVIVFPVAEPPDSRRQSKLPRLPSGISTSRPTTRSSSAKKDKDDPKPTSIVKPKSAAGKFGKAKASSAAKSLPVETPKTQRIGLGIGRITELGSNIPTFGSPMKVSPIRQPPKLAPSVSSPSLKAMVSSPSKSKIPVMQHAASPGPSAPKLARSVSLTFHSASESLADGSTLSTLSNALERLKMPAPSRPSTSMGFSRDPTDDDSPGPSRPEVQDDSELGKKLNKGASLSRSSTLGANYFSVKGQQGTATGSKAMKQSTLFFLKAQAGGNSKGKPSITPGGGRAPKASRNPGLATVIGSPVKGGRNPAMEGEEFVEFAGERETEDDPGAPFLAGSDATAGKGKGKQRDDFSTRRASTVSHLLSKSLNSFPLESTSGKGLMGPPSLPANLSAKSNSSAQSSTFATGESSTPPGRRSTRIAAVAAAATSKKVAVPEKPVVNEALRFLRECVIYVDVKTDVNEEAGSLFVEMLEGVGAKVLGRVGQTCTHIVYKNGLQSTINRYKLLRDPKPTVVGIAWVVDCVEQRKKVDEAEYVIDLEEVGLFMNPNKRRRSMLPKLISRQFSDVSTCETTKDEGNVSMESTSFALDDLPPLERARRRKSMLPT